MTEPTIPTTTARPTAGGTRELWLLMLRQGGRWSTRELRDANPALDPGAVPAMLKSMASSGSVKKLEDDKVLRFCVTKDCRIPHGVTLDDLLSADIGIQAKGGQTA
ncbi:MAG TPA: hypothetical protein VEA40_00510 [Ramlibacter sp.]|nr:hypothetical protein [Ramlibacter sp.]